MDNALAEIYSFVQVIPPFEQLPTAILEKIVSEIQITYLRSQTPLPPPEIKDARLYIIRKGALSYFTHQDELLGKYGEGDICAVFCQNETASQVRVTIEEDSLLYSISYEKILELLQSNPEVIDFFHDTAEQRLNKKMSVENEDALVSSALSNALVSDFYRGPVATIEGHESIQAAAIKMTELGISCLVVLSNKGHVGIVTDKDIRRRCVAQDLSTKTAVSNIMTPNMATIEVKKSAFDALMTMTSKHIQHLPVTQQGSLIGMVTVTDLLNHERHNAINFTSMIHKAEKVSDLVEISKLLPQLQIRMAKLGTTADHVAKSISAITMAFTIRLIEMSEKLNGSAPVPYAWLCAGSQARQEQLAHSDQDNALIISNELKAEHHYWFHDLATFVCDGLAACGFIYCPGDIMATNNKWRQKQAVWAKYFDQWVNTPDPKALLNGSVFFDLETVHGDASLLEEVRAGMLAKTKQSSLFIAHLSRNALNFRPPLGFFRDFVLINNGEHKAKLDLKHNGIAPIVDLARIYALSEGISAVNTLERLQQAAGTPSLTKESAANLIDAFAFLSLQRMKHQARQLQADEKPDNYLMPKEISRLEREHLKDAFKVIKTMQDNRQSTY